ncbi:class I SAM-dependent methyltransferase [Neotabrizicola sp. VNH66]|uniref:class I SAM-dependent methyltransferase n=1 Tax=Neotabrizicola sp. VNH66 TaxID=3400918 RepID=UPI003C0E4436
MAAFDFLGTTGRYSAKDVHRMNMRHSFIIEPFLTDLDGAKVLDLAAHDGRWSYALAAAGARQVIGVEARPELVAKFSDMPHDAPASKVELVVADLFDALQDYVREEQTFDVVAIYGVLYHVMDHFLLLRRVTALRPKLVIIDSEFITGNSPMVQMVRERTDNPLNAIEATANQEVTMVGIPSVGAMEAMADVLGYRCFWLDWEAVSADQRAGLSDYFRNARKRRRTCYLRPK